MGDSTSTALAVIDERLEELHALMTGEPIDVVTERYQAWKSATHVALADVVVESAIARFDLALGSSGHGDGHRPTPPVYLHGAASRAFLVAMKTEVERDPAAILRVPPSGPRPAHPLGDIIKVVDLLKRRLPRAFRGRPETERDVQNGFETLLAGAGVAYERESDSIVHSSRTWAPDFTFPDLQTALELKLCHGPDREKEILAEIHDEILVYRTRYPHIVIGVYDLGFIREPDRFLGAFQSHEGVWVRVIKHQSGQNPGR